MFQNLKTDIVYYKSLTDFEMEFNLCGCCRMRLLTDKAPTSKNLVHNLVRAVSRSRVIIIIGPLLGDEGIINIVAGAISKNVIDADTKQYGINDDQAKIISGATPLVTKDGVYGGCIIESGPQSMILLCDDKEVRKTIMNTLIHPYIEELCALELKAKATQNKASQKVEPSLEEEIQTETKVANEENDQTPIEEPTENDLEDSFADVSQVPEEMAVLNDLAETHGDSVTEEFEETVEIPQDKNDDIILSGNMLFEFSDGYEEINNETDETTDDSLNKPVYKGKPVSDFYSTAFVPADEYQEENHIEEDTPKKSKKFLNIPILIIAILLFVLIAVLVYCIFYIPASNGVSPTAYLQDTFNTLFG